MDKNYKDIDSLKISSPPTGVEPAIPGLGGRCRIHWATEAHNSKARSFFIVFQVIRVSCQKKQNITDFHHQPYY